MTRLSASIVGTAFAVCLLVPAVPASAQLLPASAGPVVYGHHHLSVYIELTEGLDKVQ